MEAIQTVTVEIVILSDEIVFNVSLLVIVQISILADVQLNVLSGEGASSIALLGDAERQGTTSSEERACCTIASSIKLNTEYNIVNTNRFPL